MTILDMRRRKIETIKDIIDEIHKQFAEALGSDQKAYRARLYAGQLLVDLKRRFDLGEMAPAVDWWKWYKENFVRSRKDAQKVMTLALAEDPEAAAEDARQKNTEHQAKHREKKKGAYVSADPVDHLLHLVDQLDAEQRQRFLAEIRRRYDD